MNKILAILILIICNIEQAYAAPSISGVTGIISHNSNIVISGASFGTAATVYKWDDFEGATHTTGQNIGAGPGAIAWNLTNTTNNPAKVSNSSNRGVSTKFGRSNFTNIGEPYSYRSGINFAYGGINVSQVYISWWWRYNENGGTSSSNWKPFWPIARNTDAPEAPRVSQTYGVDAYIIADDDKSSIHTIWDGAPSENNWVHQEFFGIESSGDSATDGTVILKLQKSSGSSYTSIFNYTGNTKTRTSDHWNRTLIGDYSTEYSGLNLDIDYDDIYIASSRARIEIGNNNTFSSCTHRELQPVSVWSDNSVTITVNRGSFGIFDSAYLFVIDSDGNASTGYPITFGNTVPTVTGVSISGGSLQ